ncbi:MAG: response regulator [Gemmatimonadales bacterium]
MIEHPATILVVEDNPTTRKLVRIILTGAGYLVLEAPNGRVALEVMAQRLPDLVLQDLILPDIDGFKLVRRLREIPGADAIPVIALSGYTPGLERAQGVRSDFTDQLLKPVEPSDLRRMVAAYLEPTRAEPHRRRGAGRRVLLVDDDPTQLKLSKAYLIEAGFRVSTAGDGVEALEVARAHVPDAVVSDVRMARLDGFGLCLAVRADPKLAAVPVVLTSSAFAEAVDRARARRVGATAFVVRTPDHQALIEAVLAGLEAVSTPKVADARSDDGRSRATSRRHRVSGGDQADDGRAGADRGR